MTTVYPTLQSSLGTLPEVLLHPKAPQQPPWRLWPWVLVMAFLARAGIAIGGDFILHPDEILQYLEPAHRAIFGHGVVYWEYFYGGRQWFIPGLVAAVLGTLKTLNLTDPWIYTDVVKLLFCGISLGIPAGMYFFTRRHFGESSARIALVVGSFWYELVGFAHKPMTEFVSTSILMILLVFLIQPHENRNQIVYGVACLGMLISGIRFQYAPLVIILLGLFFLKTNKKILFTFTVITLFFAIGLFDGWTWNQEIFHSYLANFRYNLIYREYTVEESSVFQYLWWLFLASSGLSAVVLLLAARLGGLRRYGFLVGMIVFIVILHSIQNHREYRFIFMVIPFWLMIAADFIAYLFHKTLKQHNMKSQDEIANFDQSQKYLKIISKSFPMLLISIFSLLGTTKNIKIRLKEK